MRIRRSHDTRAVARRSVVAGLICLSWCWTSPPLRSAELFGPARTLLSPGAAAVAVGDLNGDAAADLVGVSRDSVHVFLGDGQGGFLEGTELGIGGGRVAVGEFNGDGAADLAITDFSGHLVKILLGDGVGGFEPAETIDMGQRPHSVVVAEFDNDGNTDLAVSVPGTGAVSILLGDGTGGFESVAGPGAHSPGAIAVADFDDDGNVDLAVASYDSSTVSVSLGDGNGGFAAETEFDAGRHPTTVAAEDFDNDGNADLAVGTVTEGLSILLGDGRGGFESPSEIAIHGVVADGLAVADLNGDGRADIAVSSGGELTILLGDGRGGFAATTHAHLHGALAVDDFDLDGAVDLAAASWVGISIMLGDGNGGLGGAAEIPVGSSPRSTAAADFNGDGNTDLVVGHTYDPVSIWLGDGRGDFEFATRLGMQSVYPTVGDFNGDGRADLALPGHGPAAPDLSILLGEESGGFDTAAEIEIGNVISIAVGEFNGDGHADLAVANEGPGSHSVGILLGEGNGRFDIAAELTMGWRAPLVVVGEFNGDDRADLAVGSRTETNCSRPTYCALTILLGDGSGGFEQATRVELGGSPESVAIGDFNADGAEDLAVVVPRGNATRIFEGDGEGGFDATGEVSGSHRWVAANDLNEDDAIDLAIVDSRGFLSIRLGDAQGDFRKTVDLGVGRDPRFVTAGEFNDDGAVDLVVVNQGSASLSLVFQRLGERADVNGSNRIDGFDAVAVRRLAGLLADAPGYRRNADVDLDGTIDGIDLTHVASRLGTLSREASSLRAALDGPSVAASDTITMRPTTSEGDLFAIDVLVHDASRSAAAADFAVTFGHTDGDQGQVLQFVGFAQGTYFSGGPGQLYSVETSTPGRVEIAVTRLPAQDGASSGELPLISLMFRPRREGAARLAFAPSRRLLPSLLSADDHEVPGVRFAGTLDVAVNDVTGEAPGQRIGFAPARLDFGEVDAGMTSRKTLRISNFGFFELRVNDVETTEPEWTSFFTSPFTVPPFGFVEVTVEFTPTRAGVFSGELVLESDDPERPDTDDDGFGEVRLPLLARSSLDLFVSPRSLDFSGVAVGGRRTRRVRLTNRSDVTLTLTSLQSSDGRFVAQSEFSRLDPGDQADLNVRFQPDAPGRLLGTLTLGFDAPEDKVAVIALDGTGETDSDGDAVQDRLDNCDFTANPDQIDTDGDGAGDLCDLCPNDPDDDRDADGSCGDVDPCPDDPDDDGDDDGLCADTDNCPLIANPGQEDLDGDTVGDPCDDCVNDPDNDADTDGLCAGEDNCPLIANTAQEDLDGDGVGDLCDTCPATANPGQEDADGDAVGDLCDDCPNDPDNDGDTDGSCADEDNCPLMSNPSQEDVDGDAEGDPCDDCPNDPDNDGDSDGLCADEDNCPFRFNPGQQDVDRDGAGDHCDTCPATANPGQEDADGDSVGDLCDDCPNDPDDDGDSDGLCADEDNCPAAANPGQADLDEDGWGDPCDNCSAATNADQRNSDLSQFGGRQAIGSGRSVAAADIDGDGDLDALSGTSWHENLDGAGGVWQRHVITAEASAVKSLAADVDGDGDLDVLSATAWHENPGTEGSPWPEHAISIDGAAVLAEDIDGDGDLDVLSSDSNAGAIAWHENLDARGRFGLGRVISDELVTRSVVTADVDGDGDIDILSAGDVIGWHENVNGLGSFAPRRVISGGLNGGASIAVADVDRDGDPDLLSASSYEVIAWHENLDGSGEFTTRVIIDGAWEPGVPFAADLDADGYVDLLAPQDFRLIWYKNLNGTGFGPARVIADAAGSMYAADLDGNGTLDILSASEHEETIAWYANGDRFGDACDNCPDTANPSQDDSNGDSVGDACELP
ncbi:MAG: choice-of-anchor D domain-containing protein [bacterium]|nr:choice-of-anchor D domain-containing protein [bacterium]